MGYCFPVTIGGETWSAQVSVKDGVSVADVWRDAPIAMEAFDLGGGNTRLAVLGTDNNNPFAVKMWYSDDDGATWESAITLINQDSNNDLIYGIKKYGNKLAVTSFGTFDVDGIYLMVCDDMTAGTPTFSSPTNVADGVGNIDLFTGSTSASGS